MPFRSNPIVKPYAKGNSDLKIEFLQFLQAQSPGQRLVVVWDGASYHRSEQMQQYKRASQYQGKLI